jgi:hypothetical protein
VPGDLEELARWAQVARQGAQRASILIRKATEILGHLEAARIKGDKSKAFEMKDLACRRIMEAFAACMDPKIPGKEAYEMAMREVEKARHIVVARGKDRKTGVTSLNDKEARVGFFREGNYERGDWAAINAKADNFATKILHGQSLGIPSEDIVAALAENGYDAQKIASYYAALLQEVFDSRECDSCGRKGGSTAMKDKTLKTFLDWKRSMEPKVNIEVTSDLDNLGEEELQALQDQLTPVVLQNLLQKEK